MSSKDSETFDLAGKSAATVETAVKDAFAESFALEETIRLTFVTGAGKLARQKYDEGAAKAITSTLRDLGYEDDHGGGAGTFKLQHDTGKNLKTVVVYPKVSGGVESGMGGMSLKDATPSLLDESSPAYKLAYAPMNVFEKMVASKCKTWSQKKGCVAAMEDVKNIAKDLEGKLMTGKPLSDSEQEFYDDVSITSLEEKQAALKEMMHKQVDEGSITAQERKMLLEQVQERIETLTSDVAQAENEGKPKRVANLTGAREKALARKEKLDNCPTKTPPPLKNQSEIDKLRIEMRPLEELEAKTKGRLLSVKETQTLARKDEILLEINDLEDDSRGWFESQDAFEFRLEMSRKASKSVVKKSSVKAKPGSKSGYAAPATKWVTPGPRKQVWSKPAAKPKPTAGGVFAAMMMDSDSD